jgi:hypothetical protein
MLSMNRVGVVIQGPLISEGRTGKSLTNSESPSVKYNCHLDVISNYQLCKKYFNEVVLSTWESPELDWIRKEIDPSDILVHEDQDKFESSNSASFRNRNKQAFTSLQGLGELRTRSCGRALKIRTDMQFSEIALIQAHKKILSTNAQSIIVPFRAATQDTFLQDFYFAGLTTDLIELLKSTSDKKVIFDSIHEDLFHSRIFFSFTSGLTKLVPRRALVYPLRNSSKISSWYSNRVWNKYLELFPRAMWESATWRGESLNQTQYLSDKYFEDSTL